MTLPPHRRLSGFSLVEIVIALGLFAFVAVALIGLFSVGLRVNRESIDEIDATNLAQSLLATRRAAPLAALPDFPLPPFNEPSSVSKSAPVYMTSSGAVVSSKTEARFGLLYRIVPPSGAEAFARAYICLYWPAQADPDNAQGRCEMSSSFRLP